MEESQNIAFRDILESETELARIQDVDILLEALLAKACRIAHADAGSIYVVENDRLHIKYSRNDTKQKELLPGQKLLYSFFSFPISEKSIAGYAALTGTIVNEPDVYNIPKSKPYLFNPQTDIISGYKTHSNMAIPLKSVSDEVIGVLQILNKKDEAGNFVAFDNNDELSIGHFASTARLALEHANLTRAMVIRMTRLSELRDPKETGAHVNRVASYAIEIYDRWAYLHHISEKETAAFRDTLRIAAMFHDVGKVAISDTILKKPGKLTDEEYAIMRGHTWIGATVFANAHTPLDEMSRDVALNHHENWDGTGYPGWIDPATGKAIYANADGSPRGKKGEEIPLAGRIVALSDVFDALSCKRIYKPAWDPEDVVTEIRNCRGKKFDPDVVDAFFDVLPNIRQIQSAFPDE